MRPDEWTRVKDIFAAALPLPGEARSKYLNDACGPDAALRVEVETLLASHEQATPGFLLTPADISPAMPIGLPLDGRQIGPYRFSSRIGVGGMGEVYKARDTRLDRTVAIKVLPAHIAADQAAKDRFEREARAVASLNHPNICTLHDIGSQDGIDFLVMEYLDGETLANRLRRGAIPPTEALQYAIQICSALNRVHRAGIVHRDLKPANIMLTRTGAKLLDFGLAKITAAMAPNLKAHANPDVTSMGAIAGTVQYMAPEVFEGKPADARSDIFAFGAVLYEMITGNKAYPGQDVSNIVHAIRETEPPHSPRVSALVDRIVRTCVAKDPDNRWQSARDLLRVLMWTTEPTADLSTSFANRPFARGRALALIAGVTVLAATVLATVGYRYVNRSAINEVPARFEIATPTTSDPLSFALSPNGRHLTFVAASEGVSKLWLRPLDQLAAHALPGTDGASFPFWAPDGRAIAFFADGKLKRLDLNGGPPRVLADAPTGRGGTWSETGVILFAPTTASVLTRVDAGGGTSAAVTKFAAGQNSHRWPQFLPDGKRFLFLSTQGQPGAQGVFLGSLDGSVPLRLLDDDAAPTFALPDMLLLIRKGSLVAMKFDPWRGAIIGDATPVVQPIGVDPSLSRGALSVSANGAMAHRSAIAERRQLIWTDRTGAVQGSVGTADDHAIASPELTRDGRRVAVFRTIEGKPEVWLVDAVSGVLSRFTFNANFNAYPVWSPDARRVVFTSQRDGGYDLVEQAAQASAGERPLLPRSALRIPNDFSPDGRLLLFAVQVPQTGVDLWALPITAGGKPFPVAEMPFDEMSGQFSPDGRWIAYQSNAAGRMEVYVRPFPGPGEQYQVSLAGGGQPRWSVDGSELFFVALNGYMMSVRLETNKDTLEAQTPMALFPVRLATGANVTPAVGTRPQYDIAPDGRFLINMSVAPAPPITIALNWVANASPR